MTLLPPELSGSGDPAPPGRPLPRQVAYLVSEWTRTVIIIAAWAIGLTLALGAAYAAFLGIMFLIEQLEKLIGGGGIAMALAAVPAMPIMRSTDTVIRDTDGEEVVRLSATEMTIRLPDGSVQTRKLHDNLILCDGTNFNGAMLFANPPAQVGVCRLCRRPPFRFLRREKPTHGLVRLTRARTCAGRRCAVLCCSRHRVRCRDGRYRCLRCARKWAWRKFFVGLFFART